MSFYLPLILFSFVSAITPGPNNIMLMMSGSMFGIKKTMPLFLGVCCGYPVMLLAIGSGIGVIFTKYPYLHPGIKVVGSLYMLYMAWKIITATVIADNIKTRKPLTFFKTLLFQWINPKAVVMAIGVMSAYTTTHSPHSMMTQVIIITLVGAILTIPTAGFWVFGGAVLSKMVKSHIHLRVFNYIMGGLLILSIGMMLVE